MSITWALTRDNEESMMSTMELVEKTYIYWILKLQNWPKEKSATALGLDPSLFYWKREHVERSIA
jgi:hypothetical protein